MRDKILEKSLDEVSRRCGNTRFRHKKGDMNRPFVTYDDSQTK